MEEQRKKYNFNPLKLTHLIFGGQKQYEYFLTLADQIKTIDIEYNPNLYGLNRKDLFLYQISMFKKKVKLLKYNNQNSYRIFLLTFKNQTIGSVHISMFIKCIEILGSEQQKFRFMQKALNYQIIGCYAQTQIAHGSDVQNLETTATFDPATDQFIMNTPTIRAMKYWPGQLGLFANYALVFAQLIINNVKHGVQSFVVPIRDQQYQTLPNIEIGDIGPKIGFHTKDNGYLIFHNVRIPRKNMLNKYIKVAKDGTIIKRGNPKISYATMLIIRKLISSDFPMIYGIALTIAVRYAIKRKQFKDNNQQQIKIMDYQIHKQKLIPLLAQFYAIMFGAVKINKLVNKNYKNIVQKQDQSLMSQAHITVCFAKAFSSQSVLRGMKICRLACGGHGFAHYSGLPIMEQEYFAHATHEGQNSVLYLQVSKFILKSFTKQQKKPMAKSIKYLESLNYLMNKKFDVQDTTTLTMQNIRILLAQRVCHQLRVVGMRFMEGKQDQGIRLVKLAKAHAAYFYFTSIQQNAMKQLDEQVKQLLIKMTILYGIDLILRDPSSLIESEMIKVSQISILREKYQMLLDELRPAVIGLIDGFGIPQFCIMSIIGKDENSEEMYERMFRYVSRSSLSLPASTIRQLRNIKNNISKYSKL